MAMLPFQLVRVLSADGKITAQITIVAGETAR